MKLIDWLNNRMKKLDIWDIALTKLTAFFGALLLVKWWPPLASLEWYWCVIAVIVFAIRPVYRFYFKK